MIVLQYEFILAYLGFLWYMGDIPVSAVTKKKKEEKEKLSCGYGCDYFDLHGIHAGWSLLL